MISFFAMALCIFGLAFGVVSFVHKWNSLFGVEECRHTNAVASKWMAIWGMTCIFLALAAMSIGGD